MSVVQTLLRKPQHYVRFLLSVVLLLGCLGVRYRLNHIETHFFQIRVIDTSMTGGCVVALALFASGSMDDNLLGEVLLPGCYLVLTINASIQYKMHFWHRKHDPGFDHFCSCVALFGGTLLWAVDFGLSLKHYIDMRRAGDTTAPATEPTPEAQPTPEPEPKAKHKKRESTPETSTEPEPKTKTKHKKRASKPETEPETEPEPKTKTKHKKRASKPEPETEPEPKTKHKKRSVV